MVSKRQRRRCDAQFQVLHNQIDCDEILTSARYDDVGVVTRRLDELLVAGLDESFVLRNHSFNVAPALTDISFQTANKADIWIC